MEDSEDFCVVVWRDFAGNIFTERAIYGGPEGDIEHFLHLNGVDSFQILSDFIIELIPL